MEVNDRVQKFQMTELIPKGAKNPDEDDQPHDCSDLQRHAFELGRQKGIEEGRAQCQAKVDAELKRALDLANQIGRARVAALEERDRDVVEVALAIAQKILLRELESDKEMIVRQVRQVLDLLLDKTLVTVRVHPQDLETLKSLQADLRKEFVGGDHLVLEAHDHLELGGCLVEQPSLQLDARIQQQLEAVAAEFGLEPSRS